MSQEPLWPRSGTSDKHYEIAFTRQFQDGIQELPREIYPIIDRQMTAICANPYARDNNRTRMKNAPRTFRVRIGAHVRMLYRVIDALRRVDFVGIGPRSSIYDREIGQANLLTDEDKKGLIARIKGLPMPGRLPVRVPTLAIPIESEPLVEIEELSWISEDELFLLQVPHEAGRAVLQAKSIEELQRATVDAGIRERVLDYLTNPGATPIEKLYTLSPGQGVEAIARRPLSEFLVTLDPEQRSALQRIRNQGPYLLKGSAGTGKSLVGLYHIRDLILARAGESLFDAGSACFGVITYTNTLVDVSLALLRNITPASAHSGIHCTTLDKIAFECAQRALGRRPSPLETKGMAKFLRDDVAPIMAPDSTELELLERLGAEYVAEEIEQAIIGNGLTTVTEYLDLERRGRKRGLGKPERQGVWSLYARLMEVCNKRKVQTFEQQRALALQYLRAHPEYPRYSVLFVDEAQDFSKVARQLCLELIADPRYLLLAADSGQSIYTIPLSWRRCDPRFNFQQRRPILLSKSYRTTLNIGQAIRSLRSDPGDEDDRSIDASPVFPGPLPHWIDAQLEEHPRIVAEQIAGLVYADSRSIHPGQMAIIVRETNRAARFAAHLQERGIKSMVVEKGSPLQMDGEHIHIVTAHSSKGLGFPVVFVPEVSQLFYPWQYTIEKAKDPQQREDIEAKEQRLLYVALSRASYRLYMVVDSGKPSPFLSKLDQSNWSRE